MEMEELDGVLVKITLIKLQDMVCQSVKKQEVLNVILFIKISYQEENHQKDH